MSIPGARRVRCHTKHRRASGEPKCRACGKRANPCDSTWERTLTFRTHRGPRLLKRLGKGHPNTLSTSPADVESDAALRNRIEALRYRVAFPFFVSASSGSPSLLPASPSDATAGFPESSWRHDARPAECALSTPTFLFLEKTLSPFKTHHIVTSASYHFVKFYFNIFYSIFFKISFSNRL